MMRLWILQGSRIGPTKAVGGNRLCSGAVVCLVGVVKVLTFLEFTGQECSYQNDYDYISIFHIFDFL